MIKGRFGILLVPTYRVNKGIKTSVLRLVGKCGIKSRTLRKLNYKKQTMLMSSSVDTMNDIQYKQVPSHGLNIVSEPVYNIFFCYGNHVKPSHPIKFEC